MVLPFKIPQCSVPAGTSADFFLHNQSVEWAYPKANDKMNDMVKDAFKERVKETFTAFDQSEEQAKSACEVSPTLRAVVSICRAPVRAA